MTFRLKLESRAVMPGRGSSMEQGHEVERHDFGEKSVGLNCLTGGRMASDEAMREVGARSGRTYLRSTNSF